MVDTHPLFRNFNKNDVKKAVKTFENTNGTKLKDFTVKEVVIILHNGTQEKITRVEEKLDKRIEWGQKALSKHDVIIQKITDNLKHITTELPEKGWCGKVTNALFPNPPELPLDQKVDLMWHDRRWIKRLLGLLITLTVALGGGNIIMQL